MYNSLILDTTKGPFIFRNEQAWETRISFILCSAATCSRALQAMPVDDAIKDSLLRMQFQSQTASYRAQYPAARFDILERDGVPIRPLDRPATPWRC